MADGPHHGGDLATGRRLYGEPPGGWLDLSTGIHPRAYPVPAPSPASWHRLPEGGEGLAAVAAEYYGTDALLAVPGSQAAIGALPRLRAPGRVAVLWPTYGEHAYRWARAGHTVARVTADGLEAAAEQADVVVVTTPNNPDGHRFEADWLEGLRARLAARGGWLVVDEAFADPWPGLAPWAGRPGLVVLRSVGKFFGLAGARLGFVLAESDVRADLAAELGPWPVPGPVREAGRAALADAAWQAWTRHWQRAEARRLAAILAGAGYPPVGGTRLFQWVATPEAEALHERLARAGVWTRLFRESPGVRVGLPGGVLDEDKLRRGLAGLRSRRTPDIY